MRSPQKAGYTPAKGRDLECPKGSTLPSGRALGLEGFTNLVKEFALHPVEQVLPQQGFKQERDRLLLTGSRSVSMRTAG